MTVRDLANELGLNTRQAIDGLWTLGIAATGGEMTLSPEMIEVARKELPRLAPREEPKPKPTPQPKAEPEATPVAPPSPPAEPAPVKKVTKYLPSGHRRRRKVQP